MAEQGYDETFEEHVQRRIIEDQVQRGRRDAERRNAAIGYGVVFAVVGGVLAEALFGLNGGTPGVIVCALLAGSIGASIGRSRVG